MCGISGFIDLSQSSTREDLIRLVSPMSAALQHRGPDYQGIWVDEKQGIALAHQRLSIIDGSLNGHQPMHSINQRYVMAYNGEIYNFQLLRQELIEEGESFRGYSDTEVLLSAFSIWGIEKTLEKINGMFAIVLFDREAQQIYLIRDRLGQKPMYYSKQGSYFFFASELKALRQHPKFQAVIRRDSVASYMRLNYVPAPFSIYENTFKLQSAHFLRFSFKQEHVLNSTCYWDQQKIAESSQQVLFLGSYKEAETHLESLLKDSVALRMLADVPLGAFLSGGIDSSLIVSLMQAQSNRPVKTFTMGFQEAHFNEAKEAKAVANYLGTEHTELYVSPEEARNVIPKLPMIYDEPFSDASQIPTYLVSQMARQHVTVALSGDGGDEFFGGYNRHYWVPLLWRRFACLPSALKKPALKMLRVLASSLPKRDKIYKLAAMLEHNNASDMYIDLISSWKKPNDIMRQASDETEEYYKQFFKTSSLDLVHQMMSLDARHYLPDDILVKVDRASMAVGLEARSPFLDYRLVEFAWQLPLEYKVEGQSGKKILKKILEKHVPSSLVDRPKMGFAIPIGDWLRGPLKEWANDLLDRSLLEKQRYFHSDLIHQKWLEHQSGRQNWQYCLWNVLMFQSFMHHNEVIR